MSQISTALRAKVGGGYAGRVFLGLSAVSAFLSVYSYAQSFSAQKEIDFRKRQLSRPVYTLSEDEHVNPPWNHDNLDDWLFRRGTSFPTQLRSSVDPSSASVLACPLVVS